MDRLFTGDSYRTGSFFFLLSRMLGTAAKLYLVCLIPVSYTHLDVYKRQNKNSATGLTTGFADLDRVTCGWQPGEEIVIAARPAVGKTNESTARPTFAFSSCGG